MQFDLLVGLGSVMRAHRPTKAEKGKSAWDFIKQDLANEIRKDIEKDLIELKEEIEREDGEFYNITC